MTRKVSPPFRAIAEYTYDWETWVDAEGVSRWVNHAVERITGYRVDECLALPDYPLALAYEPDRALLSRVLSEARAGGSGNDVEFRVRHKDGGLRWVAISWQALRDEHQQPLGYRTSIRDIDHRKEIEAELHVMRRRAEAAVVARTQLLANVSHELRSPVHCIAGFTEVLLEGSLSSEQRRYLELIARECGGMLRHVEDLLQSAAIEAGGVRLSPRPFELGELGESVVEAARANASARGLALELQRPGPTWLLGDPLRIGQVLRNLIDNALKFTDQGGVRVSIATAEADGGSTEVTLNVEDSGSGIDPTQVERLLAPFEQASTARRAQGVGLGLSIVQRLVSAMHGTLDIEGRPGQGTRVSVCITLPQAQPQEQAAPALTPKPRKTSATALVVDDSAPARELLSVLLSRAGYRVIEAASGREALARFAESPCDLVLLDYQMPDADGIETALALRRLDTKRKPRIYLLTANVFARAQVSESRAAIDGILEKPVSRATLLAALDGSPPAPHTPRVGMLDPRVIADLREVPSGQGTLFDKLLATTCAAMKSELRALARAAEDEDRAELAKSAHRIAGHAAMIGARAAADLARALERRAERCKSPRQEAARVRAAWKEAEQALRSA